MQDEKVGVAYSKMLSLKENLIGEFDKCTPAGSFSEICFNILKA